jgi:hypothetical protein
MHGWMDKQRERYVACLQGLPLRLCFWRGISNVCSYTRCYRNLTKCGAVLVRLRVSVGCSVAAHGRRKWWLTKERRGARGGSGDGNVACLAVCAGRRSSSALRGSVDQGTVFLSRLCVESVLLVANVLLPGCCGTAVSRDGSTIPFDRVWSALHNGWCSSGGGCTCGVGRLCLRCYQVPSRDWRFLPAYSQPGALFPYGREHWFSGETAVTGVGRAWFVNMFLLVRGEERCRFVSSVNSI